MATNSMPMTISRPMEYACPSASILASRGPKLRNRRRATAFAHKGARRNLDQTKRRGRQDQRQSDAQDNPQRGLQFHAVTEIHRRPLEDPQGPGMNGVDRKTQVAEPDHERRRQHHGDGGRPIAADAEDEHGEADATAEIQLKKRRVYCATFAAERPEQIDQSRSRRERPARRRVTMRPRRSSRGDTGCCDKIA